MKNISLLDCTLRDGGYINNWNFGEYHIKKSIQSLENTGVDIIELGFLKDEPYNKDRTVFNNPTQIAGLINLKKKSTLYTAMVECVNPIPLDKLPERTNDTVDAIRVIVWKNMHDKRGNLIDALQMGYKYCKGIVEKGYKLFVQPARVDQYSDDEFIHMVRLFSQLNPDALYIVDSWGTMYADKILHYLRIADKILDYDVAIGYHGHNNMMQAFANATAFINSDVKRKLIIDASVYGMGRGAGNLNSEIIAKYLNDELGKKYNIIPFIDVYDDCVKDIYNSTPWGYMTSYFLTAIHNCNPQYGTYYGINKKVPTSDINNILNSISDEDKVLYSDNKAEQYLVNYMENK